MIDIEGMDAKGLSLVCEQRWQEGDTLDFKRTLPGRDDRGRRELLKDVCAFANAGGGVLAFGLVDEEGAAKELAPITDEGPDAAILRVGQIIDAGIEPRLRGWRLKPVDVEGGYVLLLRVPASFDGPHRYVVNDASRFVMRSGRHTVDLTYQQLRSAFGSTSTLLDRARAFRNSRLEVIPTIGTPLKLKPGPLTVVHLIPIEAMAARASVDVTPFYYDHSALSFSDWGGGSRILNLDGIMSHISGEQHTMTYSLLFRSGALETTRFSGLTINDDKTIPSLTIADFMREAVPKMAGIARKAGLSGPAIVAFSMLRVGGWHFAVDENYIAGPPDRNDLIFPEAWIEDIESLLEVDAIVKPILDLLWQSYGQPSCKYYRDGKWAPRR